MPRISLTPNLCRHVDTPGGVFEGSTVGEALAGYFEAHPAVRGYVLDDQGAVRHHVVVFVNGRPVSDRDGLSDEVAGDDTIFVFQSLSGG